LDYSLSKPRQIVIAGKKDVPETQALFKAVHSHFLPKTILLLADGSDGQKFLGEKNEAIRAMSIVEGKPAAYVCENFTCKAPVTDPKALAELLKLYRLSPRRALNRYLLPGFTRGIFARSGGRLSAGNVSTFISIKLMNGQPKSGLASPL